MKDDSFITICGWMRTELNLKGNELLAYALFWGFSQDGDGSYHGSLSDLPRWIGCDRRTAMRTIANLESKGLIRKSHWNDSANNVRCMYQAIRQEGRNAPGDKMPPEEGQNAPGTRGKMPPVTSYIKDNNKDIYKSNQSIAGARTREELVADAKREFRERAEAEGGATYTKEMMDAFCDYWAEPYTNPVGRKLLRWQGEKTWDMAARLRTWASRDRQFAAKARPAFERPKLRPAIDLTFDYAENQRKICELGGMHDGEDCGYDH